MNVAIVGIGCRFPGGVRTPEEFWELLCNGVDAISEMPADRFDLDSLFDPDPGRAGKLYTRWGGFLDRVDEFDADFFGISPREARRIDPQQRLLLEVGWEALEDAGQPPDQLAGSGAGVFVGISTSDYGSLQFQPGNAHLIDAHAPAGGALCIAANRISYFLDLHGPSIAVDTACSSSLTALHLACQSITRGECSLAIVAGVNVLLKPEVTIGFCKASMLSPDGRCRPFDANANGYVRSEGAGALVLKPVQAALDNRDPIYAVIRATSINQDGRTPGISVPNADAQKALLKLALDDAGVAPADVQFVEAHGTGTAAGDPREAEAIGSVYSQGRPADRPCLIGSVKGNLGHLEAGAGIAGLIKTALALKHRQIPPNLHFNQPSPAIPFDKLNIRVPTTLQTWPAPPGRGLAGVNSFGFGGANAHAILGEAPLPSDSGVRSDDGTAEILTISAHSPGALRDLARELAVLLVDGDAPPLRDVCYTAALRRSHQPYRLATVGRSAAELSQRLSSYAAGDDVASVAVGRHVKGIRPKLAFVFSGMGPQWWGMGRQLMRAEPVFRSLIEECDGILGEFADWSLIEELEKDERTSRVTEADRAHVANFALQIGLASLWRSWGIVPDAVVGHSSGEMAAACVAGALPLRDAVWLAYHRGRLQHLITGTGRMIAVGLSVNEVAESIAGCEDRVSLAAINSPTSVTLSGDTQALTGIGESLERQGRFWRWLPVQVPYHGPQMDRLREELLETLAGLDCRPAAIPIVSTATGTWDDGQPFDASYWWQNVRQPVLFAPAIDRLVADDYRLFVELSPHPVLTPSILECLAERGTESAVVLSTLRRNEDERQSMLRSLAAVYTHGLPIDWTSVLGTDRNCVRLPTYPWQRERHWFEPNPQRGADAYRAVGSYSGHPLLGHRLRGARPTWETDLGDSRLAYLEDHVLSERPAFAGAAHIETMLAAAGALEGREQSPLALEEVQFERLLPLHDRDDRLLQCVVDEHSAKVEIYSAAKQGDALWIRHATARLGQVRSSRDAAQVELQAIRERCPSRVAVDDFYISAARQGLRYQGAFRGIAELWQGRREALGRIALPESVTLSTDRYRAHPGLLDSAFQTFIAALGSERGRGLGDKAPFVLTGVARIASYAPVGARFWCHSWVERVDGDTFDGHVELVDDAGNVLLTCEGLRLKALHERGQNTDDLMCQEIWEHSPGTRLPMAGIEQVSPSDIARDVQPLMEGFASEAGFRDYYALVEPALNAMAARAIRNALTQLGWSQHGGDGQADRCAILPRYRQLFARLVDIAETANADTRFDETALTGRKDVAPAVRLVRESGERLVATLRGDEDARGWLVVGEASQALEDFYSLGRLLQSRGRGGCW
jgi:acyl transferase domain-containing protein